MTTFNSFYFRQLDSTNRELSDYLKNNSLQEFSAFYCDFQTQGRGMAENTWESEVSSNLLCSILIYPNGLEPEKQFYVSKLVALAVLFCVKDLVPDFSDFKIKWPNDIYAGNKKIAGILIENSFIGNEIQYSICGIGLNLNQKEFSIKIPNPVSMIQISEKRYNPHEVLQKIQIKLSELKEKIKLNQFNEIDKLYHSHLLRYNQICEFEDINGRFQAKIAGTNEYGFLILLKEDGSVSEHEIKSIKLILRD